MIADGREHDQPEDPPSNGGLGGSVRSERDESGLTGIHSGRMLSTAIKRGWLPGQRWPVDATMGQLRQCADERELTIRETAVVAVGMALRSPDGREQQIAVRNALAMEAQNMEQEKRDNPQTQQHQHLHVVALTAEERRAHIRAVLAEAASVAVPLETNGNGHAPEVASG